MISYVDQVYPCGRLTSFSRQSKGGNLQAAYVSVLSQVPHITCAWGDLAFFGPVLSFCLHIQLIIHNVDPINYVELL
jgi:hypothetical protein